MLKIALSYLSKLFNYAMNAVMFATVGWYQKKWFTLTYLAVFLFFSFFWSMLRLGNDEFRIPEEGTTDCYVNAGTEYMTLSLKKGSDDERVRKVFNTRTKVIPLLEMGDNILVDLPNGQRVWTFLKDIHNMPDVQLERLNDEYCHKYFGDIRTELMGKRLTDLTDEFGEYSEHLTEKGTHKYYFPRIFVYQGYKVNKDGVVFETGDDDVVKNIYLFDKNDSRFTLLSILPFGKTIVSWNLAYNKIADITFIHDDEGSNMNMFVQLILGLITLILLFVFIGSIPLIFLFPYLGKLLYDENLSNASVKVWFTIPYIIVAYIHVVSIADSFDMNFMPLVIMAYAAYAIYTQVMGYIDYNRCSWCNRFHTLELIESQLVDSRVESEDRKIEEIEEPCDNKERYVKVTKKYNVKYKTYIDTVQHQLYCQKCKNYVVLEEELVRRNTREKELLETTTEEYKSV